MLAMSTRTAELRLPPIGGCLFLPSQTPPPPPLPHSYLKLPIFLPRYPTFVPNLQPSSGCLQRSQKRRRKNTLDSEDLSGAEVYPSNSRRGSEQQEGKHPTEAPFPQVSGAFSNQSSLGLSFSVRIANGAGGRIGPFQPSLPTRSHSPSPSRSSNRAHCPVQILIHSTRCSTRSHHTTKRTPTRTLSSPTKPNLISILPHLT